jgi:ABC-type sugar transport system ATPase subunit
VSTSRVRADHVTKDYPGVRALDDVSVAFESGKVNALIGKNGSGKSTLLKIFSGAIQPSQGRITLDDAELRFSGPADAYRQGIATVYQEMSLIPWLSVAENIFLGRLPKRRGLIDWEAAYAQAAELLAQMKVDIDPRQQLSRLSMWQMQVVEITKALSFRPKVIMLDEPTSALAKAEVNSLFDAIRALRDQGVIIIYITHKLQELPQIADTVTVLRDGRLEGVAEMRDLSHRDIIHMMFGEVEVHERPRDIDVGGAPVLEVKGLTRQGWYQDVNFSLAPGEILGIAGMLGAGRTELLRGIFGADPIDAGEVVVAGKRHARANPIEMKRAGIGLTPEDRKLQGLILIHSIRDNLCYASLDKTSRGIIENSPLRQLFAERQVRELGIKTASLDVPVSDLSGGNQQKVVVGNWLNTSPSIMLYDEPTRGIDVSAKQQIFEIMWQQARKGVSTVFVSSELEELLEVCHRILIMRHGRIVGETAPGAISVNDLYEVCMKAD